MMPTATDEELIVLVDEDGLPTGTAEKWSSHHASTPLHLAFSCYVFDDDGMFLTTRRALTKKVWPGVWSNTVCGHPAPGESLPDAIARRLDYELGMSVRDVEVVLPDHLYRAPAFQGIVEYEFCPCSSRAPRARRARTSSRSSTARGWRGSSSSPTRCATRPTSYSWWCKNQLRELLAHPLLERYTLPRRRAARLTAPQSPAMAIEFSERIRRLPVYPVAGGYALGDDVAMLASNESPDPPLPAVVAAAQRALGGANRYPDPSNSVLRRALSNRYGVRPTRIAIGNGSCDILLAAGEALLEPGAELVYAWPSFSVYPHLAAASGARAITVAARRRAVP